MKLVNQEYLVTKLKREHSDSLDIIKQLVQLIDLDIRHQTGANPELKSEFCLSGFEQHVIGGLNKLIDSQATTIETDHYLCVMSRVFQELGFSKGNVHSIDAPIKAAIPILEEPEAYPHGSTLKILHMDGLTVGYAHDGGDGKLLSSYGRRELNRDEWSIIETCSEFKPEHLDFGMKVTTSEPDGDSNYVTAFTGIVTEIHPRSVCLFTGKSHHDVKYSEIARINLKGVLKKADQLFMSYLKPGTTVDVNRPDHTDAPHSEKFTGKVTEVFPGYVAVLHPDGHKMDILFDEIVSFRL